MDESVRPPDQEHEAANNLNNIEQHTIFSSYERVCSRVTPTGHPRPSPARVGYHTQSARRVGIPADLWFTLRAPAYRRLLIIMEPAEIEKLIADGFDNPTVRVASDDNHHFQALVVAAEFDGKRPLARHQLVYKCLGSLVGNEIHALSIRALTPDEWRTAGGV